MRAAWRLAISSLFERRSRTFLLIAVVALSSMLVSAVGVAMGSLRHAVAERVNATVGSADVRVQPKGTAGNLPSSVLEQVQGWEGVRVAVPRLEEPLSLRFGRPRWSQETPGAGPFVRTVDVFQSPTIGVGLVPALPESVSTTRLASGRLPIADDEIVLDGGALRQLSQRDASTGLLTQMNLSTFARGSGTNGKVDTGPERVETQTEADRWNEASSPALGDRVELVRFRQDPLQLTIVGIAERPPLGGRPRAYMTLAGLSTATGNSGRLSRIEVLLQEGTDAQRFVDVNAPKLPPTMLVQTSEKITSGLDRTMQANQLGFLLGTLMACIAAGFIIMTGMSTGVVERQRELAILRCIGAFPRQLAASQLLQGSIIGLLGAAIGVPLGVAAAASMILFFQDKLQAPLHLDAYRVGLALLGALVAGLVGASWPAWQATRVSPLAALASRAQTPKMRTITILTVCGVLGLVLHLAVFHFIKDREAMFLAYVSVGLPGLMLGYFLLGVPAVLLSARWAGPLIERALSLPPHLVQRSVRGTPYRFGFTAGALMAGLALMVAIWTQGGAAMRDWVEKMEFPDAFAVGLGMPPEAQSALAELPFVTDTCAISLYPVTTETFGLQTITKMKTSFVAFEPEAFFRMTRVNFVQGDRERAILRLNEGGAVIVSREFVTARKQGVGSTFVCWDDDGSRHEFEVVGVVTSPGLEVADNFFDVGEDFTQQRVHAVFGSRKDLREKFHAETITMLQFSMKEGIDDEQAMSEVRQTLSPFGVLNAGSGRQLKQTIVGFVRTTLLISSCVAVFAMLVASFGVANLIVAGIQSRQFEFGVLRAIGAQRDLLTRLVIAEVLVIVLAACALGTLMGIQGAYGGLVLNRDIWGLDLSLKVPWWAILAGWGTLLLIALAAAGPAILSLGKKQPRTLLASIRG
jgi:putative ABC transport system permease protein